MPHRELDFKAARDYDAPDRPDRLFVPAQLERALSDLAPVDVTVNERFSKTVARLRGNELEVSWEAFEDEEHFEDAGWEVATYACRRVLFDAGQDAGEL